MAKPYSHCLAALVLALLTFNGTLLDRTTGQPLTGVRVETAGPTRALAVSDASGRFRMNNLQPGRYTMTVRSNDVPRQTFSFTLTGNMTRTFRACSTTLDYNCAGPGGG